MLPRDEKICVAMELLAMENSVMMEIMTMAMVVIVTVRLRFSLWQSMKKDCQGILVPKDVDGIDGYMIVDVLQACNNKQKHHLLELERMNM